MTSGFQTAVICGLAFASSASAQHPSSQPDIVVTGKSKPTPSRIERAHQFIKRAGILRNGQQLARWVDPICVEVLGISENYSAVVNRRIHEIAAEARVPIAGEKCHPNIVISFTEDGAGLARAIHKRSAASLSESSTSEREQLLDGSAGIRWWYTTEVKGSDGRNLVSGPAVAAPTGGEGGTSIIPNVPTLNVYTSSLTKTYGIRSITSATAVVDVNKSNGLSLSTVAEYAAMVVLAEIRLQTSPPDDSVLEAFDLRKGVRRLTTNDRAFLASLYRVPLDRQPAQQRGAMAITLAGSTN